MDKLAEADTAASPITTRFYNMWTPMLATAIRGQYYGIAGGHGQGRAFVGTYLFPVCDMLLFCRGRVLMNSRSSKTMRRPALLPASIHS